MRRWWLVALVVLAACGGDGPGGDAGRAGPDDPSATTAPTAPQTTTATTAPSSATAVVAPGPLAPRLDVEWLVGRVAASGATRVRPVPGVVPPEVGVAFASADAREPFAVVAGPTSRTGPPQLGPVSGLGSTDQIGDIQVRLYSGDDRDRPGTNLEIAAFACRDLSMRIVGRNLSALGEASSVAGRLINAMACNAA